MSTAVAAAAIAVAAVNLVAALIGGWSWRRGAPSKAFWAALRTAQAAGLAFALGVGALAIAGHYSSERLFYLYALLPLAIAFIAEQLRVASAQTVLDRLELADAESVGALPADEQHAIVAAIVRREMGVMALSAAVIVFLTLRAAQTAHGF